MSEMSWDEAVRLARLSWADLPFDDRREIHCGYELWIEQRAIALIQGDPDGDYERENDV